jgi:F420-0:gamma-glutamyl ligase
MDTDDINRKLQKLIKWVADRVVVVIALLILSSAANFDVRHPHSYK